MIENVQKSAGSSLKIESLELKYMFALHRSCVATDIIAHGTGAKSQQQ